MHLRGTRCPAPNQAHVHRESWIPSRAAPNPVAWHMFLSVRMVMIGQAHAATAANAILGTSPVSPRLGIGLPEGALGGGWLIGQDNWVSRNCDSRSFITPQ